MYHNKACELYSSLLKPCNIFIAEKSILLMSATNNKSDFFLLAAIQCCSLSYEKEQLGQFQYKRTHTGVKQHNNGSILGELTKLWLSTECVLWGIVFQNVYYIMNDQSKK